MSELRKIPNVGKTTEKDLIAMGYTTIESLKGKAVSIRRGRQIAENATISLANDIPKIPRFLMNRIRQI